MKRILDWLQTHVWPWSEIWRLNNHLRLANARIDNLMQSDTAHHGTWMSTANQYWGSLPFTSEQQNYLNYMYQRGYGWRSALDALSLAEGSEQRSRIKYDKIERKS